MEKDKQLQTVDDKAVSQSVLAITQENDTAMIVKLQKFQALLHRQPTADALDKTPDGKAQTVVISHVEMMLDELFFGQWSTENFKWNIISNEVQGALELVVINPISGREVRRTGAGSVVITVDKVPESLQDNKQEKNKWALNPDNKKSNALDLAFPKLKSECLKNAASSLGQAFGRDLNRKKKDTYNPLVKGDVHMKLPQPLFDKLLKEAGNGEALEVERIIEEIDFDPTQKETLRTAVEVNKRKEMVQ